MTNRPETPDSGLVLPSGRQHELAHGDQRAVVVEVGAGIRAYDAGDRAVLDPYPAEAICDGGHGAALIPWPNRIADGRYSFDGADHQLALNEPERSNAIHGLVRWRPWDAVERDPRRVVMATQLHPSPGYPFALALRIAYELADDGLTVSTTALNNGERPCPYGAGQHPYLSPGEGSLDDCVLEFPAATRILCDDAHQVPLGSEPVAGGEFDFRSARAIGSAQLDDGFTDLVREASGMAVTRLTGSDGRSVELWVDGNHPYLQLFTGDGLSPTRRRRGLAVEPMTCAVNAFQSGDGLLRLEPGASLTTRWGVRLCPPASP